MIRIFIILNTIKYYGYPDIYDGSREIYGIIVIILTAPNQRENSSAIIDKGQGSTPGVITAVISESCAELPIL